GLGGGAASLNCKTTNVLFGKRLVLEGDPAKADRETIDLGHVGEVIRVDRTTIDNLCYAGIVPVIPSMCLEEGPTDPSTLPAVGRIDNPSYASSRGAGGNKLNVNADTAAMAVAEAIGAEKLVFLSDVNGVRRRQDD